ncbi:Uncharacterised protein [Prevotella disiens]|uniref:Uncharacterized protein n=1 Tax=Prevotella disiens TaxID=28130 RepID=A0A379DW07_9BACT|nr:Uncharacterised protein [Prevotella disiens]
MDISTNNGFILLGILIGNTFHIEWLTYLISVFCILSIYNLIKYEHRKITYVYSILLLFLYGASLYVTIFNTP